MKKVVSLLMVLSLVFGLTVTSFATSNDVENLETKKMELVSILKNIDDSDSIDSTIENFLKENKFENIGVNNTKKTKIIIQDEKVINKNVESFDIGNNAKIVFDDDNYLIHTIVSTETTNLPFATIASSVETKKVDKTFKTYSWVGLKIFSVRLKGEFEYNGSKSTADITQGSFTPGFASLWKLESWTTGDKNSTSTKDAKIYAYGSAVLNLAVADALGIDIKLQDAEIETTIHCDEDGRITESYTVNRMVK